MPAKGRFSLSPLTYVGIEPLTKIVLASPNGAHCSQYGEAVKYLFAGCLLNAAAVGRHVNNLLDTTDYCVTVIAAGEKWAESLAPNEQMRMAIEDYLGAGSILANLKYDKSAEAQVWKMRFYHVRTKLSIFSGTAKADANSRAKGFGADVTYCAQLDKYNAVACLEAGRFVSVL